MSDLWISSKTCFLEVLQGDVLLTLWTNSHASVYLQRERNSAMFPGCHWDVRDGALRTLLGSLHGGCCPKVTQDARVLKSKDHSPSAGWVRTRLATFRQAGCDAPTPRPITGYPGGRSLPGRAHTHCAEKRTPGICSRTGGGRAMAGP